MRKPGKRHRKEGDLVEGKGSVGLDEAIAIVKQFSNTKFDQTVELVMLLGIDPKQADQAKEAGAVEAGGDELVKKIQDGWMDFDVAVAHPRMMSKVGRLGRLLGPQGKMPSPKSGTVTADIETAIKEYSAWHTATMRAATFTRWWARSVFRLTI